MTKCRIKRFAFQWPTPASLAWHGEELVDWVGGNRRWRVDGTELSAQCRYSYVFDRALVSPSGRYSVIYSDRRTKGLVLDQGKILREINRSFYHAHQFAYPAALGQLPDGREVLAHCPDSYNIIQLEELATGERLTLRGGEAEDIFHSRLCFSPDGRYLLSAGWVWHPWNVACVFDVAQALENPQSLDRAHSGSITLQKALAGNEVYSAAWLDPQSLLITTDIHDMDEDERDETCLPQGSSGVWSMPGQRWLSQDESWNPQASLQACGGGVLYVENGCPHWWLPGGGPPLSWPEITVLQPDEPKRHGIVFDSPLLAAHPSARRFAAVTATDIVVVDFG